MMMIFNLSSFIQKISIPGVRLFGGKRECSFGGTVVVPNKCPI